MVKDLVPRLASGSAYDAPTRGRNQRLAAGTNNNTFPTASSSVSATLVTAVMECLPSKFAAYTRQKRSIETMPKSHRTR